LLRVLSQNIVNDISCRFIDSVERLVQKKKARLLNDRSREQSPLLLAAR
jgi:hypothetical protein